MSPNPSLRLIFFFWQIGLVDTLSLVQFCVNSGSQYAAIVVASAGGHFSDIGFKVLLEPIVGLGTSYQFVRAAKTAAERRARIATLAAMLSASGSSALRLDPATNGAMGAAIASKISYMRALLARGGGSYQITKSISSLKYSEIIVDSIKTPVLESHPYRRIFTCNSKIIIENVFKEHTTRRYIQRSTQKFKTIAPAYLTTGTLTLTKINTPLIICTFFGVGLIVFTISGALYLFQLEEYKRYHNKNDKNDKVGLNGFLIDKE